MRNRYSPVDMRLSDDPWEVRSFACNSMVVCGAYGSGPSIAPFSAQRDVCAYCGTLILEAGCGCGAKRPGRNAIEAIGSAVYRRRQKIELREVHARAIAAAVARKLMAQFGSRDTVNGYTREENDRFKRPKVEA